MKVRGCRFELFMPFYGMDTIKENKALRIMIPMTQEFLKSFDFLKQIDNVPLPILQFSDFLIQFVQSYKKGVCKSRFVISQKLPNAIQ